MLKKRFFFKMSFNGPKCFCSMMHLTWFTMIQVPGVKFGPQAMNGTRVILSNLNF